MIHDDNGNWYILNNEDYSNSKSVDYDRHRYILKRKALESLSKNSNPKLSESLMKVLGRKGVSPGEVKRY